MSSSDLNNSINVVHGVSAHSVPLAGCTVGEVRRQMVGRMHIDPAAVSCVDGVEADEAMVLAAGQVLNFIKYAGEIG